MNQFNKWLLAGLINLALLFFLAILVEKQIDPQLWHIETRRFLLLQFGVFQIGYGVILEVRARRARKYYNVWKAGQITGRALRFFRDLHKSDREFQGGLVEYESTSTGSLFLVVSFRWTKTPGLQPGDEEFLELAEEYFPGEFKFNQTHKLQIVEGVKTIWLRWALGKVVEE